MRNIVRWIEKIYYHRLALLFLILALILTITLFPQGSYTDEGDNLLGACLMSKGQILYNDFFTSHLPLPYYFLSIFYKLFGCNVLLARYLLFIIYGSAFLLSYLISKKKLYLISLLFFILASPYYRGYFYLNEVLFGAGLILLLTSIFYLSKKDSLINLALIFAGSFLMIHSNHLGLFVVAIFITYIFIQSYLNKERWILIKYFFTVLVSFFVLMIVLFFQNNLRNYFEQAWIYNLIYYSHFLDYSLTNPISVINAFLNFLKDKFTAITDGVLLRGSVTPQVFYSSLLEIALLSVVCFFLYKSKTNKFLKIFICLVLLITLSRYHTYTYFHELPFIFLLLFMLPIALAEIKVLNRYSIYITITLLIFSLRLFLINSPKDNSILPNYSGSINALTKITDKILVYPYHPMAYFEGERLPGSFYTFLLPWISILPNAEQKVIEDIEKNRVRLIILDKDELIWERYRFNQFARNVYSYVLENYKPIDSTDSAKAKIFLRE